MFENIAGKIKSAAQVACCAGIGLSVLNGIALLAREAVILGLLYIFFGSLIAWVTSLCLYGFGQLIENSDRIAGRVGGQEASACPQDKANPNQSAPDRNDGEL